MFLDFFLLLKENGLPVSIQEYITLLEALRKEIGSYQVENFYYLSRTVLVKHEQHLDKFDRVFGQYFEGIEQIPDEWISRIPEEWLRQDFDRQFTAEELAMIEAMGGLEKMLERVRELLDKQKERHEGGNTWIGTSGTSPFGAYGYNPEGIRIGQEESRHRQAVKVWDKREFKNLDDQVELNTRTMKMALKRLRVLTREGIATELDLDHTIQETCKNAGMLDLQLVPSKQNRVKVLLFLDAGGSMDDYVEESARLFSAARHEFKHLEYFYFHNCVYESVWRDNTRRGESVPTYDILNKYNRDYKVIFIGDASMAHYEVLSVNGSVEHYNEEPGIVWLQRLKDHFPYLAWLNPVPAHYWDYTHTINIIRNLMDNRMFPLTLPGLSQAISCLKDKKQKF